MFLVIICIRPFIHPLNCFHSFGAVKGGKCSFNTMHTDKREITSSKTMFAKNNSFKQKM